MAKTTKNAAKISKTHNGDSSTTNPFRPQSSYWTIVESLRSLGEKKLHAADRLVKQFPTTMGKAAFSIFKAKDKRNANGKDCEGRIIQNALVVNRPDYGAPLRELGWEVRKDRQDGNYLFGLFAIKPQARKAIERTPRKAAKATKGKAKGKTAPKIVKAVKAKSAKTEKAKSKSAADAVIEAFGIDLEKGTIKGKKISKL